MKVRNVYFRLWFQALVISLVILFLLGILAVQAAQKTRSSRQGRRQPAISVSSDDAITKVQQYLASNIAQIDPQQRFILDYLYRRYSIDPIFSAKITPIISNARSNDAQREFNALQRIAYPDKLVTNLGSSPSLLMEAANCDHIALPKNYSQQLQAEADKGAYSLTHAALAVKVAEELGCNVLSANQINSQARTGMITLASDINTPADLRYESIAFLGLTGHQSDVKTEWLQQVRLEQQSDGSWQPGSVPGIQTDHTTTLALWALLSSRNSSSAEPFIRR